MDFVVYSYTMYLYRLILKYKIDDPVMYKKRPSKAIIYDNNTLSM